MKNMLLFVLVIFLISCKKDKEPELTTYQITNNSDKLTYSTQYLDGTCWDVIVYCYSGTDVVRQDNLTEIKPEGGKSDIRDAGDNITKIKVSFKFLPPQSPYYDLSTNKRQYVDSLFTLEKGKNNMIVIDSRTIVGTTLKSAAAHNIYQFIQQQQTALAVNQGNLNIPVAEALIKLN